MREFDALCRRCRARSDGEAYRTASIICSIYNVNRSSKQAPLTPEDFLAKKGKRKQTPEQMLTIARSLTASFGKKREA